MYTYPTSSDRKAMRRKSRTHLLYTNNRHKNERIFLECSILCFYCFDTHRVNQCNSKTCVPSLQQKETIIVAYGMNQWSMKDNPKTDPKHEHSSEPSQSVYVNIVNGKERKQDESLRITHGTCTYQSINEIRSCTRLVR